MNSELVTTKVVNLKSDGVVLEELLHTVLTQYTADLDALMLEINDNVLSDPNPAIITIEKYFLELSSCLYFMCEKVEKLGIYDSLGKSKAQEVYNQSYLRHQYDENKKKPTVAELSALSEADALYDKTVSDIYAKAYRTVKNKVASAETMVGTLSKVLSHRMQESQLTMTQTGRQILNEEIVF